MVTDWDIHHGLAVAGLVLTSDAKLVALLHDSVEDGILTFEDLGRADLAPHVIEAISLLTRRPTDSYSDYIDRIDTAEGHAGWIAREVKRADLAVNLERMDDAHRHNETRYRDAVAQLATPRYRP